MVNIITEQAINRHAKSQGGTIGVIFFVGDVLPYRNGAYHSPLIAQKTQDNVLE